MKTNRYFIELQYNGTPFCGWQLQPNAFTVQEALNKALKIYFRQDIQTTGCGRTDTGVHATQFFVHFDIVPQMDKPVESALNGLNALMGYDIAIKKIFKVADDAHARFDASFRTYEYHIHFNKDPFKWNRSLLIKESLDIDAMMQAAKSLLNYEDFSCFSKTHTQTFTNNCTITKAYFEVNDQGIVFHIQANRFLRNMVRAIVGTLLQVGRAKLKPSDMDAIIQQKNRNLAGESVAACGLYLTKVQYPFNN